MKNDRIYQIEIAGPFATLYVVRQITAAARAQLLGACEALPPYVQVLCVSVHDHWQLGSGSLTVMAELKRYWLATRPKGAFRLGGALSFESAGEVDRAAAGAA